MASFLSDVLSSGMPGFLLALLSPLVALGMAAAASLVEELVRQARTKIGRRRCK